MDDLFWEKEERKTEIIRAVANGEPDPAINKTVREREKIFLIPFPVGCLVVH